MLVYQRFISEDIHPANLEIGTTQTLKSVRYDTAADTAPSRLISICASVLEKFLGRSIEDWRVHRSFICSQSILIFVLIWYLSVDEIASTEVQNSGVDGKTQVVNLQGSDHCCGSSETVTTNDVSDSGINTILNSMSCPLFVRICTVSSPGRKVVVRSKTIC